MKKLLILLCLMFPLMAQSVNDTDEAKKEIREQEWNNINCNKRICGNKKTTTEKQKLIR